MDSLSVRRLITIAATTVAAPLLAQAAGYNTYQAGLYDSSTTGVSHTGTNGQTYGQFVGLNAQGAATGSSQRFTSSGAQDGFNYWYWDPTTHQTTLIGFVDSASDPDTGISHTGASGVQFGSVFGINSTGQVAGTSTAYYYNGNSGVGTNAWIYTPGGTTVEIGLQGGIYNNNFDTVTNKLSGFSNAGQATGLATRANGGTGSAAGFDAFYYQPTGQPVTAQSAGSVAIGLANGGSNAANYTRASDSYRDTTVFGMNANGQVAGLSANYARTTVTNGYYDAFLYDPSSPGSSKLISLTGSQTGTSTKQYAYATITTLNNAAVAGTMSVQNGSLYSSPGASDAWVYNIGSNTTTQVGLGLTVAAAPNVSAAAGSYVGSNDQTRSSTVSKLNSSGNAIGSSLLYSSQVLNTATTIKGDISSGSDAFYFNGANTIPIGLTDATHTSSTVAVTANPGRSGYFATYSFRNNTAQFLNNSNQVAGTATRFTSSVAGPTLSNGQTTTVQKGGSNAWFYDAATNSTVTIGLTDAAHTTSDGLTQVSTVSALNNSGQVLGTSNRYSGSTQLGADAYLYSKSTGNQVIGLTDALHTASDGTVQNTASFLTDSGLAAGTATRYQSNSTNTNGTDVWLFDSSINQTYTLTPSASSSGFASATVNYLGENGLVLGTFTQESSAGVVGNTDLYAYKKGGSIIDLGLASADMTAAGWQNLANMAFYGGSLSGNIAGYGLLNGNTNALTSYNNSAALIFTAVPEPTSLALIAGSGLLLLRRRKTA